MDPGNARLTARLGRRLADQALTSDKETDPDEAWRARGEAEFLTKRALQSARNNEEIEQLRAETIEMLASVAPRVPSRTKRLSPQPGQDFVVTSAEMPMKWVPALSVWVAVHEVTQKEFGKAGGFATSRYPGATRPVDSASWNDANEFCASLNRIEREAGRLPPGYFYTLPTGKQWELFRGGAGWENAVFGRKVSEGTAEVGSKPPNLLGLYDMVGNVWEWTLDWAPGKVNKERALRGRSFVLGRNDIMDPNAVFSGPPTNRYELYGFRVVLVKTGRRVG